MCLVRPSAQYAFHVCRGPHTQPFETVVSKAFRLVSSRPLTDNLLSFKFRCSVASPFIFNQYFHADCSFDLANYMSFPTPAAQLHTIFYFCSYLFYLNPFQQEFITISFFYTFSWNTLNCLLSSVFPTAYDLTLSRREYQDTSPHEMDLSSGLLLLFLLLVYFFCP